MFDENNRLKSEKDGNNNTVVLIKDRFLDTGE